MTDEERKEFDRDMKELEKQSIKFEREFQRRTYEENMRMDYIRRHQSEYMKFCKNPKNNPLDFHPTKTRRREKRKEKQNDLFWSLVIDRVFGKKKN